MTIPRHGLPKQVFTADPDNPRGESRVQVDVGQTGFFEGREFRTFKEWAVETTEAYVIKAVVPINIILMGLGVACESGAARVRSFFGGSEGGTFSESLPIVPANNMSEKPQPAYQPVVTLTAGGTHDADGTQFDVFRVKTSDNTNFGNSVGGDFGEPRGVGAATYYIIIDLSAFIGVFKARWEERP